MAKRLVRAQRRDGRVSYRQWMFERLDERRKRRQKQVAIDRVAGPRVAGERAEARQAWFVRHHAAVAGKIRAAAKRKVQWQIAPDVAAATEIAQRFEADAAN